MPAQYAGSRQATLLAVNVLIDLPGRDTHAMIIWRPSQRINSPRPQIPMALLSRPGQLTNRYETHANLMINQAFHNERWQPALVTQRGNVGIEDDAGHGSCHVLRPERAEIGQALIQFLIRLEKIRAKLVH
jgi:hypothetical protein